MSKKIGAIYCRVDTMEFLAPDAFTKQEETCQQLAMRFGYEVSSERIFRDFAGGVLFERRTGLTALRNALHQGQIAGVFATSFDRIARNLDDLYTVLRELAPVSEELTIITPHYGEVLVKEILHQYEATTATRIEAVRKRERAARGREALAKQTIG